MEIISFDLSFNHSAGSVAVSLAIPKLLFYKGASKPVQLMNKYMTEGAVPVVGLNRLCSGEMGCVEPTLIQDSYNNRYNVELHRELKLFPMQNIVVVGSKVRKLNNIDKI
ncbi:hypothetical protein IEQ34_008871 [Dendrobium chrysotoxum]|uniref:Uncharacterized protein n=1 Tax=Dendrobium chrysotoxum TaxID=161865 RepID=A0AAV7GX21_DENCH|nr:hypothetical protein IEQ34_008871 [Dendrobium chrysotoxum]